MRPLGRQPGSLREETRTVRAPDGLGAGLALVPAGADVAIDVRFEAVTEGVLVTGSAIAPIGGECARCLEPLSSSVEVSFQELYHYQPAAESGFQADPDDDARYLDGDRLDLEPVFRDSVVLALPLSPLCRENCPGLCVTCGARLADVGDEHKHEDVVDPRWGPLRNLEVSDKLDRQEG
jgi:uncharacterized protein